MLIDFMDLECLLWPTDANSSTIDWSAVANEFSAGLIRGRHYSKSRCDDYHVALKACQMVAVILNHDPPRKDCIAILEIYFVHCSTNDENVGMMILVCLQDSKSEDTFDYLVDHFKHKFVTHFDDCEDLANFIPFFANANVHRLRLICHLILHCDDDEGEPSTNDAAARLRFLETFSSKGLRDNLEAVKRLSTVLYDLASLDGGDTDVLLPFYERHFRVLKWCSRDEPDNVPEMTEALFYFAKIAEAEGKEVVKLAGPEDGHTFLSRVIFDFVLSVAIKMDNIDDLDVLIYDSDESPLGLLQQIVDWNSDYLLQVNDDGVRPLDVLLVLVYRVDSMHTWCNIEWMWNTCGTVLDRDPDETVTEMAHDLIASCLAVCTDPRFEQDGLSDADAYTYSELQASCNDVMLKCINHFQSVGLSISQLYSDNHEGKTPLDFALSKLEQRDYYQIMPARSVPLSMLPAQCQRFFASDSIATCKRNNDDGILPPLHRVMQLKMHVTVIEQVAMSDTDSLSIRCPDTKLFPFQEVATLCNYIDDDDEATCQLNCIYQLLRMAPQCAAKETATILSKEVSAAALADMRDEQKICYYQRQILHLKRCKKKRRLHRMNQVTAG